jgi:hypothetical protein
MAGHKLCDPELAKVFGYPQAEDSCFDATKEASSSPEHCIGCATDSFVRSKRIAKLEGTHQSTQGYESDAFQLHAR